MVYTITWWHVVSLEKRSVIVIRWDGDCICRVSNVSDVQYVWYEHLCLCDSATIHSKWTSIFLH